MESMQSTHGAPAQDETVLDPQRDDSPVPQDGGSIDSPDTGVIGDPQPVEANVSVEALPENVEQAIEAVRNEPEREDVDNLGRPLGQDAVE